MGIFGSSDDDGLNYEPKGEFVTAKRVEKMGGVTEDDERIMFMTAGSTVDVEGAGSGTSLFGNNRSRKSGTRGYVRAAFTEERVAIKIPQLTGSDERSVPYHNIVSVDLDTGLIKKRVTLQTAGPTYHIEVDKPGKDECRQLIRYVRDKVSEAQQSENGSGTDPTEQLQRIKELHDDGVLTDEEFEEKRQKLLDKI